MPLIPLKRQGGRSTPNQCSTSNHSNTRAQYQMPGPLVNELKKRRAIPDICSVGTVDPAV